MGGETIMKSVLVALDNSPCGNAVLAGGAALAELLDAEVQAVHVRVNGDRTARATAAAADVPLDTTAGPVVERLVAAGAHEAVVAFAIGARGVSSARRPLGTTAAAVATRLAKPVLIVPPDELPRPLFRRVLVPLEATSSSLAPRAVFDVVSGIDLDFVILHVHDLDSIPAFTDQPQHEQPAWAREFVLRYCPHGLGTVNLVTRVGRSGELVPLVADELDCDLIALGWSQALAPDRAPVVRETLGRSHRPVLLVPVYAATDETLVGHGVGATRA
jgi:nucleotide-binding universal stress UspA family protein